MKIKRGVLGQDAQLMRICIARLVAVLVKCGMRETR